MISPGFFGIYNAHRALLTAQSALNTVNHNLANANTEGYSRQRVDIQASPAYHPPNLSQISEGQVGQGSEVQQITRYREAYLDNQYRDQSSLLGLDTAMRDVLQQVEGILGEPSDSGISGSIQKFFEASQELSVQPQSLAVRANFIQASSQLLTAFQQQAAQLYDLRENLVGEPGVAGSFSSSQVVITVNDINEQLQTIAGLNQQIIVVKASGAEPNDLLDQRDLALDKLSKLVDIDVQYLNNGQVNVNLAGGNVQVIRGPDLVDTLTVTQNAGATRFNTPAVITSTTGGVVLNDYAGTDIQGGQLKGIIDMAQVDPGNPNRINTRSVLQQINNLFVELATQVNTLQSTGRDLSGAVNGNDLFVTGAANPVGDPIQLMSWQVNSVFQDPTTGPGLVAAAIDDPAATGPPAGWAGVGDGRNALVMAQLKTTALAALGNTTFTEFFNATVSNLGISTESYQNRSTNQEGVTQGLDERRQSLSGVNTDEEMIDMLRFQRAFEASSKIVSIYDQIYQTMINLVN